jgi:hypothetical protein
MVVCGVGGAVALKLCHEENRLKVLMMWSRDVGAKLEPK